MVVAEVPLGTRLGKYRITRRLGQGGMAIVYAGEDTHLGRPVAIKLLLENVAYACRGRGIGTLLGEAAAAPGRRQGANPTNPGKSAGHEAELLGRFLLEARAAARLNHPNVVTVHDVGQHGGALYIVMELVGGGSAQARLAALGRMTWPLATRMIADVCCGLAAAHAAGLIHRDVKPANILLADDGTAKLADFGLTKAPALVPGRLTQAGTIVGTPHYMSPEHCTSELLDERTDIYSLGAAYYTLLVGHPPFDGDDPAMIMFAHCSAPVPDPRAAVPSLPADCSRIIARAMAKARSDRFASAEEMLRDLRRVLAAPTASVLSPPLATIAPATTQFPAVRPPRRPRRIVLVVGGLAIVFACLWVFLGRGFKGTSPTAFPLAEDRNSPTSGQVMPINANRSILLRRRPMDLVGHQGEVKGVSVAGARIASAGADGKVRVWALDSGALQHILHHPVPVQAVALSPDSNLVAATGMKSVFLWNAVSGEGLGRLAGFPSNLCALAFAPSGKQLAVASETDLQLIDVEPPAKFGRRARLLERVYVVSSVAFSRDGSKLAACNDDGIVYLWDLPSLQRITLPGTLAGRLTAIALADDGATVACGSYHGDVYLWKPGTPPTVWSEKVARVASIVFAPGCLTVVVSGEWGGPLRVCDLADRKTTRIPTGVDGVVNGLSFSPDGRTLAAACADGKVRLWDVTFGQRAK